jgi:hypothetical protein
MLRTPLPYIRMRAVLLKNSNNIFQLFEYICKNNYNVKVEKKKGTNAHLHTRSLIFIDRVSSPHVGTRISCVPMRSTLSVGHIHNVLQYNSLPAFYMFYVCMLNAIRATAIPIRNYSHRRSYMEEAFF